MKPFCDLLAAKDNKTVCVVLDGIAGLLDMAEKVETHKVALRHKVALMVEECGGLDRIEALNNHENEQIYQKALQIIETFFPDGEQVNFQKVNLFTKLFIIAILRLMKKLLQKLERQDSSSL